MDAQTRTIVFINAAHALTHYALLILPTAVLAMGGAFPGLDYGTIVTLGTAMFAIYGLGSLPVGWLAERYGARAMMAAFFVGTGASLVACGLAVTPVTFAVALGLAGVFLAIYHPVGTALLVEVAGPGLGRAIGINGVFGNLGVSLAPLATGTIVGALGWRAGFVLPGAACLAIGAAYLRTPASVTAAARREGATFPDIPRATAIRAFVVLTAIAVTNGLMFNAITILLPKLLEERLAGRADALALIGVIAFAVSICGAATQFTVGRLADRVSLRALFLGLAASQMPLVVGLALAAGWLTVPLAAATIATIFGQVTVNDAMLARTVPPALRARAYAVRFFVGFVGAAAASPLVGLLHARFGDMQAVLWTLAMVGLLTAGFAALFPRLTTAAAVRPAPAE
ncbi:MFS transporter [Elioraea sp.]|uniref:MFS transporter n=1 Tax=Elioraea sp. TaxID=2185103 RepID=UPI0021DC02B8|nr:MFS transporter [Elioraea sp.]GIX08868.1 MAG: MFS transporter [Elioraea sp.]